MALTDPQVATIKATVPIVQEHGIALCDLFYKNILRDYGVLNSVFNQTNQTTGAQPRALAGALLAYAQNIDNLGALGPAVERICQKHASLSVTPDQYTLVGQYLLQAMAQLLGPGFTPEVENAWGAAYWQLANLMIGREKQLYAEDNEWPTWRNFLVSNMVLESEGYISLYLRPKDGKKLPSYLPGQYISLNIHVPGLGFKQARQFSLSDRPHPDRLRVSVKREYGNAAGACVGVPNGIISNIAHDRVKLWDVIEVSKPRGTFYVDPNDDQNKPIALMSAGSGIAPMIAILESMAVRQSRRPIYWLHITPNSRTHAFKQRVSDLLDQLNRAETPATGYTRPLPDDKEGVDYNIAGRITPRALLPKNKNIKYIYYVCGPSKFMDVMSEALKSSGVTQDRINVELFGTGGLPVPKG